MRVEDGMDVDRAISEFASSAGAIVRELGGTMEAIDGAQIGAAIRGMLGAKRVFAVGAGRSGLALRMVAMRLMHLGMESYVVGEATTPAIAAGDLLIVASASGTTSGVVHAAEVARKVGADVLAVTAKADSALGRLATSVVVLEAATKQEFGERRSEQYAGSLFEQSVLLLFDTVFHCLWRAGSQRAEELMMRHANLE